MPIVLRNHKTEEIYTCTMLNIYDLPYFGAKNWESLVEAERESPSFLSAEGAANPADWTLLDVEEHQLKVFNVKLRNDPGRRLFLDADGRAYSVLRDK